MIKRVLRMGHMTKVSVCADYADSQDKYNKLPFISIQSQAGIFCYDTIACFLVLGLDISIMYVALKILTAV